MATYNAPRYLFRRYTILSLVKPNNKFLEIGAGNLKLSQDLCNYFNKGLAVDFEPGVKKIFSDLPVKIKKKLEIKIGDFFKLSDKESFDCIIACEVMEHIEDDLDFLSKVNIRLKKGGQVIISVPAKDKYWTIHDEVVGHFRRYNKKQLLNIMEKSGFKDVKVYSYGFPFINILWVARAMHGKQQSKQKKSWSKEQQTKKSGISQIPKKYDFLGLFFNKYTFYPLNLISSLFNNFDLSEGYILVATK
ncbi:MAG TPA: methyltransferase domain-containing protein [Patescibacteria group bacterium]|nr:methyltransferase domain-containing protein [Patescibacteria group bacterium]